MSSSAKKVLRVLCRNFRNFFYRNMICPIVYNDAGVWNIFFIPLYDMERNPYVFLAHNHFDIVYMIAMMNINKFSIV